MSIHRRLTMQRYGLEHSTFLYSGVVFDPIFTPIFTAILGTGGLTFGATTITYASIASAIATTALTMAFAPKAPKPPKPEDGKVPKTQSVPYRSWGVGRVRVAGAYLLWESRGNMLYAIQGIAGHTIKSVNRFWLHDDEVNIDPVTGNTTEDDDGRYGNNVWIYYRTGSTPGVPYDDIVAGFADEAPSDRAWTANHRGDGQASIAMRCASIGPAHQQTRFPYGVPSLSVEADMALCWDFRDPAQSPTNPATWQWTRNAALIMAWHQCFNEFGHKRDYTRAILPVIDMWKEEADVCDENVALAGGGTEKRYECNGFDTTENDPKVATNAILAACDGWICERGDGALLFTVGKFREKYVTTITDADLVGHQIQYDVLFEDEINRLVPKFTYPEIDYATSDTDFFEDTAAQLVAGRVLSSDADYGWCHQWRQARRLGIRDWRRLQEKVSGTLDLRLSAINAVYTRWVRMQTPLSLPRLYGKLVENRKSTIALMRGGFNMEIMQHPDNIDAWTPATDEGQQPPVPPKPNAADVVTPVINLVQAKSNGNSVYIRVVIVDPIDDSLTPMVRYRLADNGTGNPGAWVEQEYPDAVPGVPVVGYVELNTGVVPSDQALDVQAAFKTSKGVGNWSVTANVTSTVDPVAPAALTAFSQTAAVPHLGNAVFSLTTPNDAHVKTVKLYRKATGVALNVAVDTPIATLTVAASATYPGIVDGDVSRTNIIANGDFTSGTGWTTGSGWTIASGKATHTPAGTLTLSSALAGLLAAEVLRYAFTMSGRTAGTARAVLTGGTGTVTAALKSTNATHLGTMTVASPTPNTAIGILADSPFDGSIDDYIAYKQTVTCAPQGVWDYYAVPFNGSGVAGTPSGPVTVTVI